MILLNEVENEWFYPSFEFHVNNQNHRLVGSDRRYYGPQVIITLFRLVAVNRLSKVSLIGVRRIIDER